MAMFSQMGRIVPYNETYFDDCSDPFRQRISAEDAEFDFRTNRDILTLTAELTWDLANDLSITSITGYLDGDTESLMDLAGSQNDVVRRMMWRFRRSGMTHNRSAQNCAWII